MSSVQLNRRENELLLCCARTVRSSESAYRIRVLLQESMEWEYLLRTARRHGVAPLLYWHLEASCSEALSEDVLKRLRDHFRANSLRNLFLTEELLRVLSSFELNGVQAIPYKGPTLAASVYGNLTLREFNDLDILVRPRDVPRAKEVLVSMGYQAQYQLTPAQEANFLRSQREHPFRREDGKSAVELHWSIVEKDFFPLDTERLWERLDQIPLGGGIVPNLSAEDMLLILCVHGSRHAWQRLEWICDVAELVRARQEDLEWEWLMAQAGSLDSERVLLLGLFLASDLLGAVLPEKVSQRVRSDKTVRVLAERAIKQLFQETNLPAGLLEGHNGGPAFHGSHLKVKERLRDKTRYLVRKTTALRGEDWELLPLPRCLFPLYYVLRAIRLTGKYGPKVLKRLLYIVR